MRKSQALYLVFGVVFALWLGFSGASAATTGFLGDTVSANYEWPTLGTVLYPSGTAVVGAGVEFTNVGGNSIDFSNTNILVTYPSGFILSGVGTFDGWVFKDFSPVDIISVSLASTKLAGFMAADLSFGSSSITANTVGLGPLFAPGTFISIDVGFALIATPLPAALPLFATGLGAIGLFGWRRKRKAAAALAAA